MGPIIEQGGNKTYFVSICIVLGLWAVLAHAKTAKRIFDETILVCGVQTVRFLLLQRFYLPIVVKVVFNNVHICVLSVT